MGEGWRNNGWSYHAAPAQSIPGTYHWGSYCPGKDFFPEHESKEVDKEFGVFLQSVTLKYGKGRIVAFSDSTCFSNFCIFMGGYTAYNLGVMEYLNRINTYSYLNILFIGLVIFCLALVIYLLRKEAKTKAVFFALLIGIPAFIIATPTFSYINDK